MQEEITGDALLSKDADYVRSGTSRMYYAYPSAALPRFLVPVGDSTGLRFALGIISEPWGVVGACVQRVAISEIGLRFCSWFLFERTTI